MGKNYLLKVLSNLEIIFLKVRSLEINTTHNLIFFYNFHYFAGQGTRKGNISKSSALKIIFWHTLALDLKYKQRIQIKFSIFSYLSPDHKGWDIHFKN